MSNFLFIVFVSVKSYISLVDFLEDSVGAAVCLVAAIAFSLDEERVVGGIFRLGH